ncbi:hypothetical protein RHO12_11495 [Orbus sturtevantii]|uniref:hypothetical protein n=1 Tax=Orbus sturtevantii TaxID=3074109 RepID=UPI00370D40F6
MSNFNVIWRLVCSLSTKLATLAVSLMVEYPVHAHGLTNFTHSCFVFTQPLISTPFGCWMVILPQLMEVKSRG